MRCTKPRRDRRPAFTLPIMRRNSRSFITKPPITLIEPFPPDALAILQDACKSSIRTGRHAAVNEGAAMEHKGHGRGDGVALSGFGGYLRDRLAARPQTLVGRAGGAVVVCRR